VMVRFIFVLHGFSVARAETTSIPHSRLAGLSLDVPLLATTSPAGTLSVRIDGVSAS
jgi:hypothetical protein